MLSKETCEVDGVGSMFDVATCTPPERDFAMRIGIGEIWYWNSSPIAIIFVGRSTFRNDGSYQVL